MFAYIDPNSGSLIIQALIAGAVTLPFFFRRQIARFTGMREPRLSDHWTGTISIV